MKKIILLFCLIIQVSFASVLSFYHSALHSVGLKKQQIYINNLQNLQISALKTNRIFDITSNIAFNRTKDKELAHPFNITNININDEIDIFNKSKNKIQLILLSTKGKNIALDIQKKEFFISLINMIGAYQKAKAIINLYKNILEKQITLEKRLKQAIKMGGKSRLEYLRFRNAMVLLQYKINKEQNILNIMKSTLLLYAPKIPELSFVKLDSNLTQFLKNDPVLKLNKNKAKEYLTKADLLKESWIPKMFIGINRQYDNNPTDSGNSYTFTLGLTMHFKGGRNKSIQAAHVEALNINSQYNQLLIQQKTQYIALYNKYKTSKQSLSLLKPAIKLAQNNLIDLKTAYLKHYISFTNYFQALNILINTKISYINSKFNNITSALILNNLSKGDIYK